MNSPDLVLPAASAYVLPPSLELSQAETLYDGLRGLIGQPAPLRIDASDVERVSTACVQVLAAAAIAAQRDGQEFSFARSSPALCQAVRDLGLATVFGMEQD